MSDRELKAKITGSIDPSVAAAFRTVTDGSQKMGTALDQAGRKSSTSLKDLGRSTDDVRVRMVAVGAAIGTMAGFLSDAARKSEESAAIQRQLEQAIQNTGASFDQYSDAIKKAGERAVQLGIDDEVAMQAIQALTESTGSAQVALDNLGLVQDIAAAKGMNLVTAAELVGKVMNGNVGILARYGISVDKGSTATSALAQIQTQVAGQAEAHASQLDIWKVQLDNVAESIGGALGSAAPFVAMLPGLAQGVTIAGAAIGAMSGLMRTQATTAAATAIAQQTLAVATTEVAAASGVASVASTGLLGVLGPIGLVAAAAAAAYGIYKLTQTTGHEYVTAAEAANEVTEELNVTLGKLAETGSPLAAIGTAWETSLRSAIGGIQAQMAAVDAQRTALAGDALGPDGLPVAMNPNDPALLALEAQMEALTQASGDAGYALIAIGNIMTDTGSGAEMAQQAAAKLFDEFNKTKDVAVWIAGLMEINDGLGEFDILANEAAVRTGFLAEAMSKAADATKLTVQEQKTLDDVMNVLNNGTQEQIDLVTRLYGQLKDNIIQSNDFAVATDYQSDIIDENSFKKRGAIATAAAYSQSLIDGMSAQALAAEGIRDETAAQDALGKKIVSVTIPAIEAAAAAQDKLNHSITEIPKLGEIIAQDMLPDVTYIAGLADAMWDLGHAGETNLDKIARGSTSAGVHLALFGEIQDSIISGQSGFNDQISEYGQQLNYITEAEDLLNQRREEGITITDEQLDFLNRADAAQGDLQGGIEDSTIALGMQALQYAENIRIGGEMNAALGDNTTATGDLVDIIRDLILTMDGVPEEIRTRLELEDNATSRINKVVEYLHEVDGQTSTVFIDTINRTAYVSGQPRGTGFEGGGRLGGVQSFANGGLVQLAEAGPELVSFRSGGSAMAMNRGIYALSDGDYVHTAPATAEARGRSRGRGDGMTLQGCTIILHPATTDIQAALRSRLMSGR